MFSDLRGKVISLINLASLHAYEQKVGARRHPPVPCRCGSVARRRGWIGMQLQIGGLDPGLMSGGPGTEPNGTATLLNFTPGGSWRRRFTSQTTSASRSKWLRFRPNEPPSGQQQI
jgi:hypothetical protein